MVLWRQLKLRRLVMPSGRKCPEELKLRARLVGEAREEDRGLSQHAAVVRIAKLVGFHADASARLGASDRYQPLGRCYPLERRRSIGRHQSPVTSSFKSRRTGWNRVCNAKRYAVCITQLVTRVDDTLVAAIDAMVDSGMVASRSDAVRLALTRFVDQQTRADIGARIVKGYVQTPQTDQEVGWTEAATARMVAEEPW